MLPLLIALVPGATALAMRQRALGVALRHAREEAARYRAIADHSGEASWMVDRASFELVYLSPGTAARFGVGEAELRQTAADLALDLPVRIQRFEQGDASRRQLTREIELVRADGSKLPVQVLSTLITDASGRVVSVVGAARDVSVQRNHEQAQQRFASMISHEFRTPLSTIDGAIQRLEHGAANADAGTRKRYRKIQLAVDRLLELIDEYLSPEKLAVLGQKPQPKHLQPAQLLEQVAAAARASGVSHPISVHSDGLPDKVKGDPEGIRMSLNVLLNNACKYTPAGTPITILGRPAAEGGIEMLVSDGGDGIAEDELARVCERSFRGTNSIGTSGSGLGLYMATSVVEVHGGNLTVRNLPEGGAEFRIWLPSPVESGEKPCAHRLQQ